MVFTLPATAKQTRLNFMTSTNIPPLTPGVFSVEASSLIDAPIEEVWNIILDFQSYKEWNPFVRGQTITDKRGTPLADQTPAEGHYISISPIHVPPTMGEPSLLGKSSAFVQITALDRENYRAAWNVASLPGFLLRTERRQALSIDPSGKTKYETKEVFGGIFAWLVYFFFNSNLILGFNAHAEGLKNRAERLHKAT